MKRKGFIKKTRIGKIPKIKREKSTISLRPRYKSKHTIELNILKSAWKRKVGKNKYVGIELNKHNPKDITPFYEKNKKRKRISLKTLIEIIKKGKQNKNE